MKIDYPKLNLPPCRLRVKVTDGDTYVWDRLRKIWCKLTPEEWVRRHVVEYLINLMAVPEAMIKQEHPVSIEGMAQRADIVVYGNNARPLILVECKEPEVDLDASVYAQAVRYNTVIGAEYLLITNGIRHSHYRKKNDSGYEKLGTVPVLF